MRKQPEADKLIKQMAAIRELIETHADVQQLLDLAATRPTGTPLATSARVASPGA